MLDRGNGSSKEPSKDRQGEKVERGLALKERSKEVQHGNRVLESTKKKMQKVGGYHVKRQRFGHATHRASRFRA